MLVVRALRWHRRIGHAGLLLAPNVLPVSVTPERGCSCYEREPGADDVPDWAPVERWEETLIRSREGVPAKKGPLEWAP